MIGFFTAMTAVVKVVKSVIEIKKDTEITVVRNFRWKSVLSPGLAQMQL